MQFGSPPNKFGALWAHAALPADVLPTSLTSLIGIINGRASLPDGFVPLNFAPVASGGIPPFGGDHNGILQWLTQAIQWLQAGGPVPFDAAFSTAVGGYPKGAIIHSTFAADQQWLSLVDNNTTNPDGGTYGNNWAGFGGGDLYFPTSATTITTQHANGVYLLGGTAAYTMTLPSPSILRGLRYRFQNGAGTGIVTLNTPIGVFMGHYGSGTATVQLNPNQYLIWDVVSTGTNWEITATPEVNAAGSLILPLDLTVGRNLNVVGSATANTVVGTNGVSTGPAGDVASGRDVTAARNMIATGYVQADTTVYGATGVSSGATGDVSSGRNLLGAGFGTLGTGALGSGNVQRVVILKDWFTSYPDQNDGYSRDPQGLYDCVIHQNVPFTQGQWVTSLVTLPLTYPNNIVDCMCCFDGTNPTEGVVIAANSYSHSQVQVTTYGGVGSPASGVANVTVRSRGV
jgi:hypothetical protein